MMRVVGLLVIVWLIVGAIAAFQRGYFTHAEQSCASGTVNLSNPRAIFAGLRP